MVEVRQVYGGQGLKATEEPVSDEPAFVCVICGETYKGYGHNPSPVKPGKSGDCCTRCKVECVMPARFKMLSDHPES